MVPEIGDTGNGFQVHCDRKADDGRCLLDWDIPLVPSDVPIQPYGILREQQRTIHSIANRVLVGARDRSIGVSDADIAIGSTSTRGVWNGDPVN